MRDAVNVLLKTPRSLRAVHFHPTGRLLLTRRCDMDVDVAEPKTRDLGGNDMLGNTRPRRGIRGAEEGRARKVIGASRELLERFRARRRTQMCRENVPTDIENASVEVKATCMTCSVLNRRYVTYSMTQTMFDQQSAGERRRADRWSLRPDARMARRSAAASGSVSRRRKTRVVTPKLREFETR